MKKLLLLLTLAPCIAFGQTTLIPDSAFEQALIDLGYDTGTPDGSVLTVNISSVTYLDVWSKNISDLTGIEDFMALTKLVCWDNQLSSLDVSNNTLLEQLECGNMPFSGGNNQLTSLDVTNNTALTYLSCRSNQLTSLDVSNNTLLEIFDCEGNQLTSLDVSNNTALYRLDCGYNQLNSLDVTQNTALTFLSCRSNQLTSLNVKNGNNSDFSIFDAASNLTLTCIDVDDAAYSNANWTNIDPQTSFSEDCSSPTGITELPTPNKQLLLIKDLLGRTTQPVPKTLLFYIHDDGSVEKRIQLER